MNAFEKSLQVMENLFSKDYQFALATAQNNVPTVRVVDTFYSGQCFYIVTYATSRKVIAIEENPQVSLCNNLYSFSGIATNIGHPLRTENSEIREKLIEVFEPWYFKHNNENDENMCYIKVELTSGFVYKDGVGYKIDFSTKEATEFPFESDIVLIG